MHCFLSSTRAGAGSHCSSKVLAGGSYVLASNPTGSQGFSLLEALIAVAVLAIALAAALGTAASTLERGERMRRELAMARLAENLLERAGLDLLVHAPSEEGANDGFSWRLSRERIGPEKTAARRDEPALWRIVAEVIDSSSGRSFILSTLRFEALR